MEGGTLAGQRPLRRPDWEHFQVPNRQLEVGNLASLLPWHSESDCQTWTQIVTDLECLHFPPVGVQVWLIGSRSCLDQLHYQVPLHQTWLLKEWPCSVPNLKVFKFSRRSIESSQQNRPVSCVATK